MKTVKCGLGILCVLLVLLGGHESSGVPIPMKHSKKCYMKLYPSNEFGGKHLTVRKGRSYLRHSERSLRTVGDCCWEIYQ